VTDDQTGAPEGAPPKLTLGQRLLTALPNLQREPSTARRPTGATRPSGRTAPGTDDNGDDGGTGEVVTPDAVIDADGVTTSGQSGRRRLRDALAPPPAAQRARPTDALEAMSSEELVGLIKKVDDRERFLALVAAALGVVVGIALTAITIHLNPPLRVNGHLNSKHATDSVLYLEGAARIVLSAIVVASALTRRRSFIGFALLFLGTSMGSPLFALPFWALGGYLIWRVFKYQRALTAKRGGPDRTRSRGAGRAAAGTGRAAGASGGRVPASPRGAARAGASAGRDRARAARQRGRKLPEPAGPPPSKRYTPPKPSRPRPPAPSD
jgi:hypothetical protein